jgi:hypothetical protein
MERNPVDRLTGNRQNAGRRQSDRSQLRLEFDFTRNRAAARHARNHEYRYRQPERDAPRHDLDGLISDPSS